MRDQRLADVTGLNCGVTGGQLVVVHMRDKNDLVVSLESPQGQDRVVGELVAVLATAKQ